MGGQWEIMLKYRRIEGKTGGLTGAEEASWMRDEMSKSIFSQVQYFR